MAKLKKQTEEVLGFRPLIDPDSKLIPLKQIFNGFEIEKRFLLCTKEEDFSRKKNAHEVYDEILREGTVIEQGYIKDIQRAVEILTELGISLQEFKPNTIRLRKYGKDLILTLKDRKETKKREVEFELTKAQFKAYWPDTKGARITKKRLVKKFKGWEFELDAFTDRFLVIAECEVDDEKELDKVPKLGKDITNDKNWTNKTLSR